MHKQKIIITSLIIFLSLLICYLARGWIRGSAVPASINYFYKNTVDQKLDDESAVIKNKLTQLGFNFTNNATSEPCNDIHYSGFQVSVHCEKSIISDTIVIADDFKENWVTKSKELEEQLISNGWRDGWEGGISIREIFTPSSNIISGKFYTKNFDKIECQIWIRYEIAENQSNTGMQCSRYFHFF